MKLLAYGVVPSTTKIAPDAPVGVEGDALRCVWNESIGLVYSSLDRQPAADAVRHYVEVVEHLHGRGHILPFRGGCVADGEADLLAIMSEYQSEYNALLDDLRDCEEMCVRIVWDEDAQDVLGGSLPDPNTVPDDVDSSKSGLRSGMGRGARPRKDPQTAQAEYVTRVCDRFFTGLIKLTRAEWRTQPEVALALQFLVERARSAAFAARFLQFGTAFPVRAELAGPSPLYTFAVSTPLGRQTLPEPLG